MKIKEQTRKLAAGCSKQCFEVVDETDEVSSKHCRLWIELTKSAQNTVLRLYKTDVVSSKQCFEVADGLKTLFEVVDRTDEVRSKHC
ncbi:hypothetical protein [Streptococcus pneumoniae]|uniref:hypothetical protein n=1 Tax=Streptococcus pneumoniae TaxID=1313 RepID=UPI00214D46D1|nr:hypothetical protein [Streptococcus pneumoniae]